MYKHLDCMIIFCKDHNMSKDTAIRFATPFYVEKKLYLL